MSISSNNEIQGLTVHHQQGLRWSVPILLTGEGASQLGDNLFMLAADWYIAKLTQNAAIIGIFSALFASTSLIMVFTGGVADRHRRMPLMLAVDAVQTAIMVAATFLYAAIPPTVVGLASIVLLTRLVGMFFMPAVNALIPQLADDDSLERVNGMYQCVSMSMEMAGTLIGGAIVALLPLAAFTAIDALTFLASFACVGVLMRLHVETYEPDEDDDAHGWRQGIDYIRGNSLMHGVIMLALVVNFALGPVMSLDVLWVQQVLHASAFVYSSIQIVLMVGVILGNVAVFALQHAPFKAKLIIPLLVMAGSIATLALFPSVWLTLAMILVLGFAAGIVNVTVSTTVQRFTPEHLLGRVNGALLTGTQAALPIGMALGGVIAQHVGVANVFLGGGAIAIIAALVAATRPWNVPEEETEDDDEPGESEGTETAETLATAESEAVDAAQDTVPNN
ncbi:MAG: MFS transporter [Bifidobacterium sp.]|jgi:predicted MFS family arabinose efflux permease|nr:MFS transporter [Bifidobacterium sp.]